MFVCQTHAECAVASVDSKFSLSSLRAYAPAFGKHLGELLLKAKQPGWEVLLLYRFAQAEAAVNNALSN